MSTRKEIIIMVLTVVFAAALIIGNVLNKKWEKQAKEDAYESVVHEVEFTDTLMYYHFYPDSLVLEFTKPPKYTMWEGSVELNHWEEQEHIVKYLNVDKDNHLIPILFKDGKVKFDNFHIDPDSLSDWYIRFHGEPDFFGSTMRTEDHEFMNVRACQHLYLFMDSTKTYLRSRITGFNEKKYLKIDIEALFMYDAEIQQYVISKLNSKYDWDLLDPEYLIKKWHIIKEHQYD